MAFTAVQMKLLHSVQLSHNVMKNINNNNNMNDTQHNAGNTTVIARVPPFIWWM